VVRSEQGRADEQAFRQLAEQMYDEMYEWRQQHPEASLDEIIAEAVPRRRKLMSVWLQHLACQHGRGEVAEGVLCERCGRPMMYKGRLKREVEHLETGIELKRGYYYCPECKGRFFPPRSPAETE